MLLGGRRRLNKMAPNRLHNLGRWGTACNLVAVFFVIQSLVIFCFPAALPVTPQNMNYVVVFGAFFTIVLVIIWYTYSKKRYTGPKVGAFSARQT
jgi:choline transport protein